MSLECIVTISCNNCGKLLHALGPAAQNTLEPMNIVIIIVIVKSICNAHKVNA